MHAHTVKLNTHLFLVCFQYHLKQEDIVERKKKFHLSKLVFERQSGAPERRNDVRPEVPDEDADVDVPTVRDDAALPEPACGGRHCASVKRQRPHVQKQISLLHDSSDCRVNLCLV